MIKKVFCVGEEGINITYDVFLLLWKSDKTRADHKSIRANHKIWLTAKIENDILRIHTHAEAAGPEWLNFSRFPFLR